VIRVDDIHGRMAVIHAPRGYRHAPFFFAYCCVAIYSINNGPFDLALMLVFGVFGVIMATPLRRCWQRYRRPMRQPSGACAIGWLQSRGSGPATRSNRSRGRTVTRELWCLVMLSAFERNQHEDRGIAAVGDDGLDRQQTGQAPKDDRFPADRGDASPVPNAPK
jgi:hypothetical protein